MREGVVLPQPSSGKLEGMFGETNKYRGVAGGVSGLSFRPALLANTRPSKIIILEFCVRLHAVQLKHLQVRKGFSLICWSN